MEQTNTKKLVASAVLIVASIALLAGLTLAWFTDTVANKGNKIQAGTLNVQLLKDGVDVSESSEPIFSHAAWEPGYSTGANLSVKNAGDLALKYELRFEPGDLSGSGGIENVIDVLVDGTSTGTLATYLNGGAFDAGTLEANKSSTKQVTLKMQESAGNAYQGVVATFDVVLVATQAPVEADGFGNAEYDKDAAFPTVVTTAEELMDAATKGGVVELAGPVALTESTTFAADTTLNLNGNTLTVGDGSQSIKAAPGTTLTIEGDGTIEGVVYADNRFSKGSTVVIDAGGSFSVVSQAHNGWSVYGGAGSSISIVGGTYTATEEGGGVIHSVGARLSVSDAIVNVAAKTMNDSVGIHSNAAETTLTDVVVDGNFSSAVNLNKSNGAAIIRGGSFSTTKTSDGSPDPTIRYQGTLDVSGASITRIGTGIQYTRPNATAVEGLTQANLTFLPVAGATGEDIDYKH